MVRSFDADYLCDMGGELSVAYLDKTPRQGRTGSNNEWASSLEKTQVAVSCL